MEGFQTVPLSKLKEHPDNPRQHFNPEVMKDLESSIRKKGILTPLLVRPNGKGFQVLAGARRLRVAKLMSLSEVPTIVHDLDDAEAFEVVIIDNLQREDLHPLEEAEGYRKLCEDHEYSIDDLVLKIGKSRSYVYARMKLADLPEVAKKAMWQDKLSHSTALLIARIPDPALQKQATKEIVKGDWQGPYSYRRAQEHIQRRYMLTLKNAAFPTDDAELLPAAGTCLACPKRTGNQRGLFPDVKSADVCTDPKCFDQKLDALWERVKGRAVTLGKKVLGDQEVKVAFRQGYLEYGGKYLDLSSNNYQSPKDHTWRTLLGKQVPQIFVARDSSKEILQLVLRSEAEKILKRKYKWATSRQSSGGVDKRAKERARVDNLVKQRVAARIVESIPDIKTNDKEFWQVLALCVIERAWYDTLKTVAKRRGLEAKKQQHSGPDYEGALIKALKTMTTVETRGMVMEIVGIPAIDGWGKDHLKGRMNKLFGIDRAAINRQVKAELKKKIKKKKARKTKGATNGRV